MKSLKTILCVVAAAVATLPVCAQFSNAGPKSSSVGTNVEVAPSYDRMGVSYRSLTADPKHGDSKGFNGFAIDWIHGFSVSSTLPLYVETGVNLGAGFNSESDEYEDEDSKTTVLDVSIPVNLAYRWNINENFSVQPYVGLNFKVNALAKASYDDESESMFDKDIWGKDGAWKRFQMGWHIGAGVNIKKFYIGLSYGTDFISLCKNLNTSTFKVGIGVNF